MCSARARIILLAVFTETAAEPLFQRVNEERATPASRQTWLMLKPAFLAVRSIFWGVMVRSKINLPLGQGGEFRHGLLARQAF